jgi:TolB-like protein/DNA-binding winged helix-turn-helix (wHTH) protein/Flp pilus assembly protein TadD
MATQGTAQEIRFAEYALDLRTGELRRDGLLLKLQPQPAKILSILVSRVGQVVTRQELSHELWGADTYVDFEHGLNYAIRQIRSVLNDDPEQPRYVETIPKRGYRFIASTINWPPAREVALPAVAPVDGSGPHRSTLRKGFVYVLASVAIVFAVSWGYLRLRPSLQPKIKSVAVLPLHNLSNDPEQEYFADGMTDELITDLAKSGALRVISHTSVERYKNTSSPLREVAQQLGVDAVVEGTVMRSADKVRITAQLIDARSDQHLWAESYERDLRDVFTLQDEVAQKIATEIGVSLGERRAPGKSPDSAAHEAYLRGNFYWSELTCDGFNKSRHYFEQAVNREPGFARAYVGLSESYFALADWGCSPEPDLVPKSRAAALKALELDPTLGEAHAWLGKIAFFYEWDVRKAEGELKQAIRMSPNYPEAHIIYAVLLVATGRRDLGLAEMAKAHDIDPVSQLPNVIAVVAYYLAREYDAAIQQANKTTELYPRSVGTYAWLGYAYEKRGSNDLAVAAYLKAKQLGGVSPDKLAKLRAAYERSGLQGYWQNELQSAQRDRQESPCWLAIIYAHLGDNAEAIEFLGKSSQQHCSGPHTTVADPAFDRFRQDARFRQIAAQLGM